ncbi:unnamed protein product [Nesidiocoris tenuis]|uniref:Uncharacterized protein n=1 Tax=Nesidiocoris tenuis TaxID=355587 RepID=A0A6H5HBV4_9HEMI|nr:unnamed protein product [Nesidiocoris tenuis]
MQGRPSQIRLHVSGEHRVTRPQENLRRLMPRLKHVQKVLCSYPSKKQPRLRERTLFLIRGTRFHSKDEEYCEPTRPSHTFATHHNRRYQRRETATTDE